MKEIILEKFNKSVIGIIWVVAGGLSLYFDDKDMLLYAAIAIIAIKTMK